MPRVLLTYRMHEGALEFVAPRSELDAVTGFAIGMIGVGGIGQALLETQQLFFYQQMIAYLAITWVIVFAVDRTSERTRKRIGWSQLAPEEIAA